MSDEWFDTLNVCDVTVVYNYNNSTVVMVISSSFNDYSILNLIAYNFLS